MSVDRRSVLKGMTLGGIAGVTVGGSLPALAKLAQMSTESDVGPMLALVSRGASDSAFLQAARAALGTALPVHEASQDVNFLLAVEQHLRTTEGLRIIGLLDDATATLVVDLARSAGARIHWLGHHTSDAALSRHRLLNTSEFAACSEQLRQHLHACGASFMLSEERQGSAAASHKSASSGGMPSAQWAASIGYLLASWGMETPPAAPAFPASPALSDGSFVSFSIAA